MNLANCDLEVVDKFCYLGDMIDASGGAESGTICRLQCGWKKFRELLPLLTTKAVPLKVRGKLYKTCVRPVMLYGSETWPVKAEDTPKRDVDDSLDVRCQA